MSKSVTNVPTPGVSPEEQAINKKILDLLNRQEQETELLKPLLFDQYGIREINETKALGYKNTTELADAIYNQKKDLGGLQGKAKSLVDEFNSLYTTIKNSENRIQNINQQLASNPRNAPSLQEQLKKNIADRDSALERRAAIDQEVAGLTQNVSRYEKTEQQLEREAQSSKIEKATSEIALLQADRQKKALEGSLPLSTGTLQRKAEEFKLIKANAARLGHTITGDDPSTAITDSTPGSEILGQFNRKWGLLEDAERRGELEAGAANFLNTAGANTGMNAARVTTPSTPESRYGGILSGYLAATQPYQFQRNMQFQAGAQSTANRAGLLSGLLQAGGTGAGMYAAMCFDEATPVDMKDGTQKPMREVSLDDETVGGKVLSIRVAKTPDGTVYNYMGVIVTGSHAVKENGVWIRVEDSVMSEPVKGDKTVYCLVTSEHRIFVGGIEFADEVETNDGCNNSDPGSLRVSLAKLNNTLVVA